MTPEVFRSRIDVWLAALLLVPLLLVSGIVVRSTMMQSRSPSWLAFGVLGLSLAFVVWIYVDTSYRVTSTELHARSGPLRVTVPLAQIKRIRRSNSLISAPALSLQRLDIQYATGKSVLISPDDEERFFAVLRRVAPQVVLPTPGPM